MNKFPKLRYKGFKDAWCENKLIDIASLYQPITISKGQMTLKGKYKVFGANGYIGYYHDYNHYDETLSISCRGENCGTINLIKPKSWITGNSMVVLPNEKILTKYLYYSLSNINIKKYVTGGAQPQLTRENLKPLVVVIPTLTEVTKVQTLLSKIDFLINEKEKEIKIHEKKQKKIMDMVFSFRDSDFEEVRLGDLYEFKNGISKEKSFFGHGTKIVNYMDVNKNIIIDTDSCSGLVECTKSELERFIIKSNDLLFTRTSETSEEIGLSCAIINVEERCVFSGFILKASPKKEVDSRYYAYYMRSKLARREIIKHSSITTRALTSGSNLGAIKVKFPNISYQKKIADILILNDELAQTYSEEMAQFKLMKKQLMFKMLV